MPQDGPLRGARIPRSFWKWKPQAAKGGKAQPCRRDPTARFRRRHLPRAPWQMSVRVAPPIINFGSSQISCKRDPQSAVRPPGSCFQGQDIPVPGGCTRHLLPLPTQGKLETDCHGLLLVLLPMEGAEAQHLALPATHFISLLPLHHLWVP